MSSFFERLSKSESALMTILLEPGAEYVTMLGRAGFDLVSMDMMSSAIGWFEAANMMRAVHSTGTTPAIRVEAYPWSGGGIDQSLAAHVSRAFSIGAEVVFVSASDRGQVAAVVEAGMDWREKSSHYYPHRLEGEHGTGLIGTVVPYLESLEALENLDEILDTPGLRLVKLGLGDLSRLLGQPGNDRHPVVEDAIRRVVGGARDRGLIPIADVLRVNQKLGMMSESVLERIDWLTALGVKVVGLPRPISVGAWVYGDIMAGIRARQPAPA